MIEPSGESVHEGGIFELNSKGEWELSQQRQRQMVSSAETEVCSNVLWQERNKCGSGTMTERLSLQTED